MQLGKILPTHGLPTHGLPTHGLPTHESILCPSNGDPAAGALEELQRFDILDVAVLTAGARLCALAV